MPQATLDDVPRNVAVRYSARDADATLRISSCMAALVSAMGLDAVQGIDMAVIPMVERMQTNGILADIPHFQRLGDRMSDMMDEEVRSIWEETGRFINPNSGDQVAPLIFDELGMEPRYLTGSGKRGSTDDKTLEGLRNEHPVMPHILNFREYSKIRDSFAVVLPRMVGADGRIRCVLRVTRVSSGRLAASSPNLMAIPVRSDVGKEVRSGFIAPEGCLLGTCDLDQIEMRVMAHRSGDPTLVDLFTRGEDIHAKTASQMFGIPVDQVDPMRHRYPAKRVGFGVITGITGKGLSEQMALAGVTKDNGDPYSEDDCDRLIADWFSIYPGVRDYMEDKRAEARRYGYVRDMWGRIRYLPGIHDPRRWMREEAERQSHSHDIQGSAQGIMKLGMKAAWDGVYPMAWREGVHCEPLLQVHDELLHEIQEDAAETVLDAVKAAMCSAVDLCVPVKAKSAIGPDWGALEK